MYEISPNTIGRMIDDLCEGRVDDVILRLTKMQYALKRDNLHNVRLEREPAFADLPKVRPVKKGRVVSIDVKCPTCSARPGKPCVRMTRRGKGGEPTTEPLRSTDGSSKYHVTRREAAKK